VQGQAWVGIRRGPHPLEDAGEPRHELGARGTGLAEVARRLHPGYTRGMRRSHELKGSLREEHG